MLTKPIRVPRYLVHVVRRLRAIEKITHEKSGLVIDSLTVKASKQPTGRVQLRIKN